MQHADFDDQFEVVALLGQEVEVGVVRGQRHPLRLLSSSNCPRLAVAAHEARQAVAAAFGTPGVAASPIQAAALSRRCPSGPQQQN